MSRKTDAPKARGRVGADNGKPPARPRHKAAKPAERDPLIEAANCFKAIGEPTRLGIIQFLRGCEQPVPGDVSGVERTAVPVLPSAARGARVTEICRQVTGADTLTSTFSHHIKELRRVGLIRVERDGKNRWCQLEPAAFETLLPFLPVTALPHPIATAVPAEPNENGGQLVAPVKRARKSAKP